MTEHRLRGTRFFNRLRNLVAVLNTENSVPWVSAEAASAVWGKNYSYVYITRPKGDQFLVDVKAVNRGLTALRKEIGETLFGWEFYWAYEAALEHHRRWIAAYDADESMVVEPVAAYVPAYAAGADAEIPF